MKIGNLDISSFKVGGVDCSIYLGDTKLYPTVKYKYQAKYTDGSEYKLECDTATGLTSADTRVSSYTDVSAVTVGDCILTLKTEVFSGFTSLESVSLPNSLVNINARAFNGCRALTNISIPSTVTYFGTGAFSGCTSLESINIPSGITSLPVNCFGNCYSLEEIEIPSGITTINGGVFSYCSGLTSIDIPSGVTSIGQYAFYGCSGLSSIDIPSGVTSIGGSVFYGCSGLTSVTVNAITPPTLGTYVFNYTNDCPIYVPSASVETYKAATNWSTYASRIEAIPSTPTLQWEQYYLGDTVPSSLFYGVKLRVLEDINKTSIEFGDAINDYIGFAFDINSEEWYALDLSGEQIDISEYYDETEQCYVIYFSDFGLGAMPLYYPAPNESFEFDVQLYQ